MSEDKSSSKKENVLELEVYMHCKACERSVFNTLREYKGVETVKVDMNHHKAIVTGQIDREKVVKKLKKKTGKRAEIIKKEDKGKANKSEMAPASGECSSHKDELIMIVPDNFDQNMEADFSIFSDENPNACSII